MCGFCVLILLHCIRSTRFANPDTAILIRKIDFKSDCRRCSFSGDGVSMCIAHHDNADIFNLRKTFGGAFSPYLFAHNISDSATDLVNDDVACTSWDKKISSFSHLSKIHPPILLPSSSSFASVSPASVEDPLQPFCKMIVCIDNTISMGVCSRR